MKEVEFVKKYGLKIGIVIVVILILVIGAWYGIKEYRLSYEVPEVKQVNYYVVEEEEKMGVMDKTGAIILPIEEESIKIPNPELPFFICYYDYDEEGNYKTKVVNDKQEEILQDIPNVEPILMKGVVSDFPYEKNIVQYQENGKWGIASLEGKKITEAIYDSVESMPYKEGNLLVEQQGKYGVINNKGYTILKIGYDKITADNYYTEEKEYLLSGYITGIKTEEGYRYGYYNAKGKEILPAEYNEIYRIVDIQEDNNAYLIAQKDGRYGVTKNGKTIIPYDYQEIEYNSLNHLFLVTKGSKLGIFNQKGEVILDTTYADIQFSGIYLLCKRETTSEVEIYKPSGEQVPNKDWTSMLPTLNENYFIVSDESGLYGVIDKEQKQVIPIDYTYISYLSDDSFIVCNQNGKYGIMNTQGKSIIEINYDSVQKIQDTEIVQVVNGDSTYFYNPSFERVLETKNPVIRVEEDVVKIYGATDVFYLSTTGKVLTNQEVYPDNELYTAKKDGKYGFVNKAGEVVVDYRYESATEFNSSGFAGIKQDGKWGIIDKEGNILVEPCYLLDDVAPDFIGKYYRVSGNYGDVYYTDEIEE